MCKEKQPKEIFYKHYFLSGFTGPPRIYALANNRESPPRDFQHVDKQELSI